MHGKYDGAAVKQTGMLQNQYLLDTRRYSTLNASLVTQACTNTRMPLTLCPPLLCDTTASGCHVSPRGRNRDGNGQFLSSPKVGFRLCSIILARQISRCLLSLLYREIAPFLHFLPAPRPLLHDFLPQGTLTQIGLIGLIRSCPTLGIFLPVYQKVSFFAPKSDKFLSHLLPPDDYSSVILSKVPRVYTEYRREVARINCVSHPEFFNSHPLFNPSALSAAFLFFFGFGTKVVKSFLSELNWARIDNTVFPPDVAPFKRRQSFRSAAITRGKR